MIVKKYSVNAPRDWLVWWLPVGTSVLGLSLAAAADGDLSLRIGAALTAVAFAGIFAVRMYHRFEFKRSIRGYTDLGIGVIGIFPLAPFETTHAMIDRNAYRVVAFWAEKLKLSEDACLARFNGTFAAAAETITNTWSGPRREIGGMSVNGFANVKVGPGDSPDLVQSRLRHEFSHVLLDRMGHVDHEGGAYHHRLFAEHGFGDV